MGITARAFERGLAGLLGYPEGQLDQRTRALRESGLLPVGARGLSTPPVSVIEAAYILCCLAPMRAKDAATVGPQIARLEFVPCPGAHLLRLPDGRPVTLVAVLAAMLSGAFDLAWDRVEIGCDGSYAVIHMRQDGIPPRLLFAPDAGRAAREIGHDRKAYDLKADVSMGHQFKLGAGLLTFLATWLGEAPPPIVQSLEAQSYISLGAQPLKDVGQLLQELTEKKSPTPRQEA